MTDTEKRRTELLEQTRQLYSEEYAPPAVHPRYGAIYKSLYQEQPAAGKRSTFGIRLLIAVLLFGLVFLANKNKVQEAETVMNEIKKDVWTEILKQGE